ncbi:hypothetical protein QTO34_015032 [Cnephaeus nilssonii]|uniref:Uncharacterized protein n=1 Tax=Cnephaeus nilssonii TaxID=3371016 RepID=A0AA40I419_CNENI|nr:hypothetical protein QTO34_015032 [Eptesicus nilssonii]
MQIDCTSATSTSHAHKPIRSEYANKPNQDGCDHGEQEGGLGFPELGDRSQLGVPCPGPKPRPEACSVGLGKAGAAAASSAFVETRVLCGHRDTATRSCGPAAARLLPRELHRLQTSKCPARCPRGLSVPQHSHGADAELASPLATRAQRPAGPITTPATPSPAPCVSRWPNRGRSGVMNLTFMCPVSVDKVLTVFGSRKAMDADAHGIVLDCSTFQWTRQDSTRFIKTSHELTILSFNAHRAA